MNYPKWVRGQIAQDAEDEARIEREWQADNPDARPYVPPTDDPGTPPSDVSQSSVPGDAV